MIFGGALSSVCIEIADHIEILIEISEALAKNILLLLLCL